MSLLIDLQLPLLPNTLVLYFSTPRACQVVNDL